MDSANSSASEEICSQTSEELAEFPFFETDIKELIEVHTQESELRSHVMGRPAEKRKRTQKMREKSLPAGERRGKPPNYFVSIPVTNPKILDKIEDIQQFVLTKEPRLLPAVVPVGRMHMTLIVAHLNTPAEVERAVTALQQCKNKVDAILEGKHLSLLFQGIGQFNDQILFAKLSDKMNNEVVSTLGAVAESVEELFRELDVNIEDSKAFKPHATFLKLSKAPILRRKRIYDHCWISRDSCPIRGIKIQYFTFQLGDKIDGLDGLCHFDSYVGHELINHLSCGSLSGGPRHRLLQRRDLYAPQQLDKGLRKICPELYREYENTVFGTEVFTQIDLCSMHKKNQPSGYYHCEASISVGLNSTPHPSNFLVESSDVANTLEPPPEKLAKQVELEKLIKSDFKGKDIVCKFQLSQLSAIELPNLDGSTQSPSICLSTCDAFTQVDHPFSGSLHVQKEGFDKMYDDLLDIKTTIQSSLECTQAGIQNGLNHLQSAVQEEAGRSSAHSAVETEMRELKCTVQSEIKWFERSIKSSFDILNSNIAALNQNIVELGNVLTLIHACSPSGAKSQDV